MNNYEGIFILRPDIKEDDLKAAYKTIADLAVKNGGSVKKEDPWGKRPLSYPIDKVKEAHYYKLDFEAPSEAIAKIEAACKLNAEILRVMITRR